MSTNKLILRTIEEFHADYTPIYKPFYPLLLTGKTQAHKQEVGKVEFKRMDTVGDVRAKHFLAKDNILEQVTVGESKKSFKKYFLANQYRESELQDRGEVEQTVTQVLDEHHKQADELLLFGEGTANNNVVNNGLYWSGDPNFVLENSIEIATVDIDTLIGFHSALMDSVQKAKGVAGRKMIIFYGDTVIKQHTALYKAQPVSFKKVLADSLPADFAPPTELPAEITPANSAGWIIVNFDMIKTHYLKIPALSAQGVNVELMYAWFNFLMGSWMVEVLKKNALIRQPVTFQAP